MISYKDMTFCRGEGCLNFGGCFRALTPKIIDGAKKIGLPISQFSDPTELDCYLLVKSEPKLSLTEATAVQEVLPEESSS